VRIVIFGRSGAVFGWKVSLEVHAIVEHPGDLDPAAGAQPKEEKMSRLFHSPGWEFHAISSVP
jgi:hypothetical protein